MDTFKITITDDDQHISGSPFKFNTKEAADMCINTNVSKFGGIEKELHDIFTRTIYCTNGFKVVAEKIS